MSMYSSYTDLNNVIKENIVVGHQKNDRVTNQKVRFFNRENEYWGTFEGVVNTDNAYINGGEIRGVKLFDCSAYTSDGSKIDLTYIAEDIEDLQNDLRSLSGNLYTASVRSEMSMKFGGKIPVQSQIETFSELFCIANDMLGITDDIVQNQIFQISCIENSDERKFREIEGIKIYESDYIIVKNSKPANTITKNDISIIKQLDGSELNAINDRLDSVDEKIATVSDNFVFLSTSEYEALGDIVKTDGKIYFIYDEDRIDEDIDNTDGEDDNKQDADVSDDVCSD